jgi:hypothetical protein
VVDELNISWTAPFSLRTRADLITYCVELTEGILTSSRKLISLCNLSDTTLTLQPLFPQDIACNVYQVTVMAANELGNGTTASVVHNFLPRGTYNLPTCMYWLLDRLANTL